MTVLGTHRRLGPYEILQPIGAGGMGQMYKARDTRLNRTVAIKVLPPEFATRPDWKQSFERKAQTIASLNHPRICTLHDVGQQDGIDYLVMEYLEGHTLAHRLEKGALPLDEALKIGIEDRGRAGQGAHGIVHRDVKPANIKINIRRDGQAARYRVAIEHKVGEHVYLLRALQADLSRSELKRFRWYSTANCSSPERQTSHFVRSALYLARDYTSSAQFFHTIGRQMSLCRSGR